MLWHVYDCGQDECVAEDGESLGCDVLLDVLTLPHVLDISAPAVLLCVSVFLSLFLGWLVLRFHGFALQVWWAKCSYRSKACWANKAR